MDTTSSTTGLLPAMAGRTRRDAKDDLGQRHTFCRGMGGITMEGCLAVLDDREDPTWPTLRGNQLVAEETRGGSQTALAPVALGPANPGITGPEEVSEEVPDQGVFTQIHG